MGSSKHHFGALFQNSKARDAEIQFTWELFLRITEVHIELDSCGLWKGIKMLIFNSIWTAPKILFLPFSIHSISSASWISRKLKFDSEKEIDTVIVSDFAVLVV
jgi:hypothetical protein